MQALNNYIYIVKIVKLSVKARRGKRNLIPLVFHDTEGVVICLFSFIRTYAYTFSAIYTPVCINSRKPFSYADSFGRAMLEAVRAPFALIRIKRYGVLIFCHNMAPSIHDVRS